VVAIWGDVPGSSPSVVAAMRWLGGGDEGSAMLIRAEEKA
jgi:hypothetical protein